MTGAIAAAWLLWYAYNGAASAHAFAEMAQAAPRDPAPLLGELTALGPDLNTPITAEHFVLGQSVLREAEALETVMTPEQRALLKADRARYGGTFASIQANNRAYHSSIEAASDAYPADDTLALLAAEALAEDGNMTAAEPYVERVRSRDPQNIMAAHLCIHIEDPEKTVPCADVLDAQTFSPAAEHLAHMSAHTWIETGAYDKAVAASERAWQLIEALPSDDKHRLQYQEHDMYVGFSAAMAGTDYAVAKRWAERAASLGDTIAPTVAAVRFGHPQDVSPAEAKSPWVRGWIAAHDGNVPGARSAIARLRTDTHSDIELLANARTFEAVNDRATAIRLYRRAAALQHERYSSELIPLWIAETAQGGFLLRTHDWGGAQKAFQDALQRYPHDPRAELGLRLAREQQTGSEAALPDIVNGI